MLGSIYFCVLYFFFFLAYTLKFITGRRGNRVSTGKYPLHSMYHIIFIYLFISVCLFVQARRVLWWELRVGSVTVRDLCSSWGDDSKQRKGGSGAAAAVAPVAKTLMSGSAPAVDGREWVSGGDPTGAASRWFFFNIIFFYCLFFF